MALLRRTKRERSTDGTMSLMEHLYELRRRLFFAILGLLGGVIVGFVWYYNGIPALGIRSLGDLLLQPYCDVPSPPRQELGDGCRLLATSPFSPLQIALKCALMAGAVVSSPVWLYQLWSFVTPALYAKERRYTVVFVASAAALMVLGATLAYLIIPKGLKVLLGFGGDVTASALNPESYFGFLISVLLIFGVSFLLPLLLIMLNFIGILTGARLAKARRYSMFGLVVFAGLTVPGNDPITMLGLAVSLCLLYEIAVQVSKIHDKRKGRRLAAEGFGDLDDDQASPTPVAAAAIGAGDDSIASSAIPAPTPTPAPVRELASDPPVTDADPTRPRFDPDAT
ncbi:twin-arginine translocase subunit TatC [Nakamurella lactea]|uniref:twin-arginine translocase subunit TatC n=1 Tax=Nakamurella lactea TaxID=459515 RepID=UPI00040C4E84|nr:twin-arginine translocase subunit TatC [Nakamurella lactea]